MLSVSSETMNEMARRQLAEREVGDVMQAVRTYATLATDWLDDALLRHEVQQTLVRCDELELTGDGDRLTLCLLDDGVHRTA